MKTLFIALFALTLNAQTQTTVNGRKAYSGAVNAQTSTYQALVSDFNAPAGTIPVASGTFTITLVASTSQPLAGQCSDIINYGSGVVTVARSGQNINGGTASLTLAAGSASSPTGVHICSDGANYVAQTLGSSTASSNAGCPSPTTNVAGWVCLESHNASTSNELDFTTCFTASGFDQFKLEFIGLVPTATGGATAMEMSTNGGMSYDTSTSNYSWGGVRWTNNTATGTNGNTGTFAYVDLTGFDIVNTGAVGFSGEVTLFNFTSASLNKIVQGQVLYHTTSTIDVGAVVFGDYLSTTVVNAVRIYMQTHNTAAYTQATTIASGTVRCYGVQH